MITGSQIGFKTQARAIGKLRPIYIVPSSRKKAYKDPWTRKGPHIDPWMGWGWGPSGKGPKNKTIHGKRGPHRPWTKNKELVSQGYQSCRNVFDGKLNKYL